MASSHQPFAREGYALMGAAFEVHNVLGGGLLEEIYQESFEIELGLRAIPFRRKEELRAYYKDHELKKKYGPDLLVYDAMVVELKAVGALCQDHEAQIMNYMRISKQPIAYLINFGPIGKLQYQRLILSQFL